MITRQNNNCWHHVGNGIVVSLRARESRATTLALRLMITRQNNNCWNHEGAVPKRASQYPELDRAPRWTRSTPRDHPGGPSVPVPSRNRHQQLAGPTPLPTPTPRPDPIPAVHSPRRSRTERITRRRPASSVPPHDGTGNRKRTHAHRAHAVPPADGATRDPSRPWDQWSTRAHESRRRSNNSSPRPFLHGDTHPPRVAAGLRHRHRIAASPSAASSAEAPRGPLSQKLPEGACLPCPQSRPCLSRGILLPAPRSPPAPVSLGRLI